MALAQPGLAQVLASAPGASDGARRACRESQ